MSCRRFLKQEAGAVLLLVLAFIGLAVPLAIGAIKVADELNVLSRVYDKLLRSRYTASAGAELAFWTVINNPSFDDNLTPVDPCTDTVITVGGEQVTVTVCRVFTVIDLQGQGLVVTKTVTPATAQQDTETLFTYTITIENAGSADAVIKQVYDYLPPKFLYVNGSTSGLTTSNPQLNNSSPQSCGDRPYRLYWNLEPDNITIPPGEQVYISFQAEAELDQGTYLNQASVRYVPWWSTTGTYVDVFTPFTAEVVVGSGTPYCGYDLNVMVTKEVQPQNATPGVETEFTYSIKTENLSTGTRYVCKIEDNLPPTFTYVAGSALEYPANIALSEPELVWDGNSTRWLLRWADGTGSNLNPLVSLAAGETRYQVFRAITTPEPGVDYFNEVSSVWSRQLVGGHCKTGSGDGGASSWGGSIQGGASPESEVEGIIIYDITSLASDGTVRSRIQYTEASGQIEILSWQEY
ncbi:MAG: hypothetical protein Q7K03_05060 [Dehalococcoidia bacterium]|nr:hypothetical protein [Dehalococcoidia bacterium]